MTPLDIAGKHESHESAIVIIEHLQRKFAMIEQLFLSIQISPTASKKSVASAPKSKDIDDSEDEKKSWELLIVHRHKLTEQQKTFGTLFYWAGFYGQK